MTIYSGFDDLISGSGLVYLFVQGRFFFFLFGFAASDFFQAGEIFCSCRSSSAEYSSSRGEGDSSGFSRAGRGTVSVFGFY